MSATALLQKAAQIGAATTYVSLLKGFGIVSSASASIGQQEWSGRAIESNSASLAAGLGLGLPCDSGSLGWNSFCQPLKTCQQRRQRYIWLIQTQGKRYV
ncbi:unnamed protein product [Coffea canephora]|uniref:Uncharacterized protein n=1 Tax=Coffea canephora TaxID=49390 RepID=A0A068U7K7_COFCA|nr:unnamed protein product [Coffea canephora]